MPCTHGYAKVSEGYYGRHDWQARERTNVIGALLGTILLTVTRFEFPINTDIFHSWVVEGLLPCLPQSSVMVMDNAAFHKRQDRQDDIEQAGHILEYLPLIRTI